MSNEAMAKLKNLMRKFFNILFSIFFFFFSFNSIAAEKKNKLLSQNGVLKFLENLIEHLSKRIPGIY